MIHAVRKHILLTTMLSSAIAGPALADTVVSSDSTTALATSTAGDIAVNEDVVLDVSGTTPITIDSNSSVSIGEDAVVEADDSDGRTAILVRDGTDFSIDNVGSIEVLEDFVPDDEDSNSIPDGPIAEATGRYGIHVQSGASSSGAIDNSGAITVEGLNSYGIAIDSNFTGDIDNSGTITVTGDYSTALFTQSVAGDIRLGGTITAVGEGAAGVDINGDVSGTVTIDGTINKARSYTTDDDDTLTLSRSDLRVEAPAVSIEGNVEGGIIVANRPYDLSSTDEDEDDDGVDDDEETAGAIASYGASPALVIGGTSDTEIGSATGRDGTYSLVIDGTVQSNTHYSSFDTTAVVIGGQGGSVTMADGIGVSGTVQATTNDASATALLINAGSIVPTLDNSGTIKAYVQSSGEGHVTAVKDASGTLSTVNNTGYIYATGSNEDERIALNLGANTSGVTIRQYLNDIDLASKEDEEAEEDYDPSSPTIYTAMVGDIVTGSGNDLFDISSGSVSGDTYFGAGDDRLLLSDDAIYVGDIYSAGGALEMSLSGTSGYYGAVDAAGEAAQITLTDSAVFSGSFANGEYVSVDVNGGTLVATEGETVSFDTLQVAADGSIGIIIDSDSGTNSSFDVNQATFADGSILTVGVTSLAGVDGTYEVLTAESLSGSPDLDLSDGFALPLLYTGTLTQSDTSITLDIRRRTSEELGLTGPQSQIFDAALAQAGEYSLLEASLLEAEDFDSLFGQFDGLMPDYAGGVFDFVTRASRLAARHISDPSTTYDVSPVSGWIEPLYFQGSKSADDTAGFKTQGYGLSLGLERDFGIGYLGLSFDYVGGSIKNGDLQDIGSEIYEIAGHWRLRKGPFAAFARASGMHAKLSSTRTFETTVDETDYSYSTEGSWGGWALSGMAGVTYDLAIGSRFSLRPKASVDYYWLKEDGYVEDGADMIDLTVGGRTSKASTAITTLTASYRFGRTTPDETPLTLELEGGRRSVLQSQLGSTTAAFEDGESFTLTPGTLKSGWTTEARLLAGGFDYTWLIGIGAEKTQGDVDLSARAGLSIAF
ncbi:autotransporter outer membrane beta-barrel domain-containing protein [Erythrobacter sp. SG61-1L]|uniref:autotransporter outer membrane beta-barrel domain-containing protein n=1 Tax=Erythrobacter sp. SG61-1L TaxID=1603897 RepID=UPI0006C90ACA|nr:autotransporter outer membrane beta-barrel domain-containing protein [Erythrobacter sp. SG61-1L]